MSPGFGEAPQVVDGPRDVHHLGQTDWLSLITTLDLGKFVESLLQNIRNLQKIRSSLKRIKFSRNFYISQKIILIYECPLWFIA